ncbi:MAG: serine hydrolase [Bacteroidetes bacterium]|nr:serine hydrolase [Bacteroidota bacterium]
MARFFLVVAFCFTIGQSIAQVDQRIRWVDSVFRLLTPAEKVGQLLLTSISSNASTDDLKLLSDLVKSGKIGSLFVTKSSPVRYARIINNLQLQTKIPLLIGADLSKGLPAIFDSTMHFYDSMVLKAIENDSLKRNLETEIASQVKTLGIRSALNPRQKTFGDLKFLEIEKTVLKKLKKGEAERQAFLVGNNLLITAYDNPDATVKTISKLMKKDKALTARIDSSVKKILMQKYEAGLFQNKFVSTDNLLSKLHSPEALLLKQQLAQAEVTVVKNDSSLLPIKKIDDKTFASVSVGSSSQNEFTHYLSKYAWFRHHSIQNPNDTTGLEEKLNGKDVIIVGLFAQPEEPVIKLIKRFSKGHQLVICDFSNPLQLKSFEELPSLIAAYSSEAGFSQITAQIIFGGIGAKGKLPMQISDSLFAGKCIRTNPSDRLSYQLPEAAGMDSRTLDKIESIANEAINIGATPCVNVLVAKNGKVIYEKSFGSLTYEKKSPVTDETIFDLASITKVSATLQAVMYMQEKGLIDINKKASVYLPELRGSNKEDFTIKDILTHQAGLWPFLPFWAETVKDSSLWKKYYSRTESEEYPFPVSENIFAAKSMKDSLWHWIIKAKVRERPVRTIYDYSYSDMAFYIMQHLAEKMLGMPMEDFLQKNIYRPLGAYTTGYLPLRKFPMSQIAPSEKDTLFRKSLLVGYVHDQGAAMHGGIAGHAGLFSNANDLAKLGQMWLNKGSYGGVTFFKPETIDFFTAKQYETSRRGLGWDRPTQSYWNGPTSMYSSAKTFGHTGFTGTSIWVDPEFNLVFVFLSNRVYPNMYNNKILSANIRPRIQDVVYQSIFEYCKNHNGSLKPNELKSGLTVKP